MRKLFTTIFFIGAISLTAVSQKISFGIQAGLSLANMYETYLDASKHGDNKIGAIVGLTGNVHIGNNFDFRPELNFVQKGFQHNTSDPGYALTDEMTLNYIEIPFNFLFYRRISKLQIFAGAGPSIAFAISGKGKAGINENVVNYSLHFGNNVDEDDLRRFDFGGNFFAGIELKSGLFAGINYNLGINTLIPGDNKNGTLKNNYVGFRLGYMFSSISNIFHKH